MFLMTDFQPDAFGTPFGGVCGRELERPDDEIFAAKTAIYDFARLMEGATEVKRSPSGAAIIKHMED